MRRLMEAVPGAEYVETLNADYRYRAVMSKAEWIGFISREVDSLDYTNFKNRVTQTLGSERHDLLMSVWTTMRGLQRQR
jgi:hypothetical protein